MVTYSTSNDLVNKNEQAVVLFTRGEKLAFDCLGNGETGNWVVDQEMLEDVDRVIVYHRDEKAGVNRIYLGNYAGCRKSPEAGRQIIRFLKLVEVGTTEANWNEFASSGQNPVSYVGEMY